MSKDEEQQRENRDLSHVPDNLRPHVFKKGQSGNPKGRPKGSVSLKVYAKAMLEEMDDEQRQEFLAGLPKDFIWQMAEGKAKQDVEVDNNHHVVVQFDGAFNNETSSEAAGDSTEHSEV